MIGVEATEGFRLGLIAHWRAWTPWIRSKRRNKEINQIRSLDSMGLTGLALENANNPSWATEIDSDEAQRAAEYATLELNGFPYWLPALALAKADIVADVLLREVRAELNLPPDIPRFGVLQALARGDGSLAGITAPAILLELEHRPKPPPEVLSRILDIIVRGPSSTHDQLKKRLSKRFENEAEPASGNLYLASLFSIDGTFATNAFFVKLNKVKRADQPAFVQRALSNIFGRRFSDETTPITDLPLPSLERLVRLAFEKIRLEDDNVHPNGVVYSPDERDDAESARSAAFAQLLNTSGRAGFDAIMRLTRVPAFPISQARLRQFARDRAAKDSEASPWTAGAVVAFEKTAETEPQTPRELQLVGLRRLADIQYDLINDDFQQGKTLAVLEGEQAVQTFVADRLRLTQGRSFSVEREVHVADEKEPDIRLRAKATDSSVPIEIKIAESWTLEELEAALKTQLCMKYLRARGARHGILLLVYQAPRRQGWTTSRGRKFSFEEVVTHLRKMAVAIAGSAVDAPQPEIATLDITRFARKRVTRKRERPLALRSERFGGVKSARGKLTKSKNSKTKRSKAKPRGNPKKLREPRRST
jgi:hypothetical protein